MDKAKIEKLPAWMPDWANEPLTFAFDPDEALRRVLTVKPPKDWKKALRATRKAR